MKNSTEFHRRLRVKHNLPLSDKSRRDNPTVQDAKKLLAKASSKVRSIMVSELAAEGIGQLGSFRMR